MKTTANEPRSERRSAPRAGATAGAAKTFFDELESRGHEQLLGNAAGTVRFDLVDGKTTRHWLLTLNKGDVSVSQSNAEADCVVRGDRAVFDGMASGRVNAMTAVLRGMLHVEGNVELLVLLQRLFPAPPRRGRKQASRKAARRR